MGLLQTIRHAQRTARLDAISRWKPQRVQRLQRRRLERLVRHAVKHSPYFAQKYRRVNLEHFELGDLPISNKAELMANFDDVVTDRAIQRADAEAFISNPNNLGEWYRGRYAVSHTSGSQGQPLLIVQDRRALEILFAIASARSSTGGKPGILEGIKRLRQPARVAIIALKRGFYPSGASFEFMSELAAPFVQVEWFSSMQPDLIQALNDYQPNVVAAYASTLEGLAIESRRLHLKDLWQLTNSSEQLTARARIRIRKAFDVPIFDHYGTGECLLLSEGCPTDGGAHVNADWAILEVVDENYRAVKPGELGRKVLITNLANRVQPFIRYEIGDCVAMATEPCRCGSRLPRIERVEGRAADIFWVEAERGHRMLTGVLFHSAIDTLREVREWQAVQVGRNRIEIRLELLHEFSTREEDLRDRLLVELAELGLPRTVAIETKLISRLAPDAVTGKVRRLVSHVGPPDDLSASFADASAAPRQLDRALSTIDA